MFDKYLSIITNFGCHYSYPYCVVKNNDINVPLTTIEGLSNLKQTLVGHGCNIVSISGGGDPLYNYEKHKDWYETLFLILESMGIPIEIHTSYVKNDFPTNECKRVVYHLRNIKQLREIKRKGNEIIRVVFVASEYMKESDLKVISYYVNESKNIDELSFRQQIGKNYEPMFYLHDTLLKGHKKDWFYIQQCDYNLYYAENRVYTKYSDFTR